MPHREGGGVPSVLQIVQRLEKANQSSFKSIILWFDSLSFLIPGVALLGLETKAELPSSPPLAL